ncbi:peptidylprolyl isomerase [Thalassomonas sp. M1454]|uniref:peptidylprolyl isomerase n=1 Tax=Thalassomonas sp. M1454 TaxID=2594477 RepID=UPI00117DCDD0|nr:peptidylprolyl isomerase [Thalassomonas sp. M1454]TRX55108.1 peptidylprolyl isomerase [Thalassomonas sp. M1454]
MKFLFILAVAFSLSFIPSASAQESENKWRSLDLNNTVLLELATGSVVIELNPKFAPKHVAQISNLVRSNEYDGQSFYRVIDNFVAQGGMNVETTTKLPLLKLESDYQLSMKDHYTAVSNKDMFVENTAFLNGFAIGFETKSKVSWLLHCPGIVGLSRQNEPDTGSSDFYITIGQAPRYLDRIMTIFGRVVFGMEHVQKLNRTEGIEGELTDRSKHSKIIKMRMMKDIPVSDRIIIEVERTDTAQFEKKLTDRKLRQHPFFYKKPPQVLDVCQVPVSSRQVITKS